MPNLMKSLTIGNSTYEVCDASAREILESKASYADVDTAQATADTAQATADAALSKAGGIMTGAINMNGQPISGLNDPTEDTQAARKGYVDAAATAANAYTDTAKVEANAYTDTAVRKAAPTNLLDNSDFTQPVAQAGLGGTHGALLYAIDRWRYNGSANHLSLNDGNGLSFAQDYVIYQALAFPVTEKTHTLAIWLSDGTIGCVTLSSQYKPFGNTGFDATHNGENMVYIKNGSSEGVAKSPIKYVALYEGEYTAETLPEYRPKGYGAELAECQRYFWRMNNSNNWGIFALGWEQSSTNVRYIVHLPVQMRLKPSVAYAGNFVVTIGSNDTFEVNGMAVDSFSGTYIQLGVQIPTNSIVKYRLSRLSGYNDSTAHIDFIADL